MSHDKTGSKTRAGEDGPVEDPEGESVLDFLCHREPPEATAPAAQLQPAPAAQPEAPSATDLKGALTRYSDWLSSWTKPL